MVYSLLQAARDRDINSRTSAHTHRETKSMGMRLNERVTHVPCVYVVALCMRVSMAPASFFPGLTLAAVFTCFRDPLIVSLNSFNMAGERGCGLMQGAERGRLYTRLCTCRVFVLDDVRYFTDDFGDQFTLQRTHQSLHLHAITWHNSWCVSC